MILQNLTSSSAQVSCIEILTTNNGLQSSIAGLSKHVNSFLGRFL